MLSCLRPLLPARLAAPERAPLLEKELLSEKASPPRTTKDTTAKLSKLRALMEEEGLDAYIVPTADAHGSEYVGECDKRRAWLSGFTGSAGVAVVTTSQAALFTDSRYHVQAAKELDSNWTLMRVGLSDVDNWDACLLKLPKGSKIGIDPTLIDYNTVKSLLPRLKSAQLSLVFPDQNLVDSIWTSRPSRSHAPIHLHPLSFAGISTLTKLTNLRAHLEPSASFLLSSLPSLAWLLNLRGSDISFSPLFYAYALVSEDTFMLWVQMDAVGSEVRAAVEEAGGRVGEYERVGETLWAAGRVVGDGKTSWGLVQAVGEENWEVVRNVVEEAQAVKNPVELEGFRRAYLRDGVAWARWAAWLDERMGKGESVSEWDAAEELTRYRAMGEHFAGLAYENISATGKNAALPHYAPEQTGSAIIDRKSPYLNDSGAQYLDGTIDTTRTVHFGKPTKEQKRAFTRILQGHIEIDSLVFPEGTTGLQIDVLARKALWRDGMNYMHGTGHGVGSYLSVHEGPQGIGSSIAFFATTLVPGHVMSNEPAFYEAGSFGIRIESVVSVKEVTTRHSFGDKRWLGFERLTMVPIQERMVEWTLLSGEEKSWLREHNRRCVEQLMPLLKGDRRATKWLRRP